MTPGNIAGMAALAGLNILALTDHNSCRNCPAFFAAAKKQGLVPVAGMELTTAEDIHMVCLFEVLDDALRFNDAVDEKRIRIANRTDIFGDQLLCDADDNIIGTEPDLLSNATMLSLDEVPPLVEAYNGICFPAHVDREANGIISILGMLPPTPHFTVAEFHNAEQISPYREAHPALAGMQLVIGSDAHYLWDIRDREHYFDLEDEPYSSELIRNRLFRILKGEAR